MPATSPLEDRIDDLYRRPLDEFIVARTALASELKGVDRQRVRQLKKPTAVPWAVNQVYWHARSTFDRAERSGAELRRAQVAALKGRSVDVRAASEAHREAVAAAVAQAVRFAEAAHLHPDRDAVARTLDALTLAASAPVPPGRLTEPLQPGGFEMLAGVPLKAAPLETASPSRVREPPRKAETSHRDAERQARAAEALRRKSEAEARRRAAAISKAEAAVAAARDRETAAKRAWERTRDDLEKAERTLANLRSSS